MNRLIEVVVGYRVYGRKKTEKKEKPISRVFHAKSAAEDFRTAADKIGVFAETRVGEATGFEKVES